jgi:hypothetical protein
MTLTLVSVPKELDDALRTRAQLQGKTVDQVAIEALCDGLGLSKTSRKRDLSEFAGSWVNDDAVDEALADQDRIDPELWK